MRLSADGCGEVVVVPGYLATGGVSSSARSPNRRRSCNMTLSTGRAASWSAGLENNMAEGCWGLPVAMTAVGGDSRCRQNALSAGA